MTGPAAQPARLDPATGGLMRDIEHFVAHIRQLRTAIGAVGLLDMTDGKLDSARDDLVEAMAGTRQATEAVLDLAESLIGSPIPDVDYRQHVEERMMQLIELCGFQDLCGQRLARAKRTLEAIDERLRNFSSAIAAGVAESTAGAAELKRQLWEKEQLAHGPSGSDGLGQDGVDALFGSSG